MTHGCDILARRARARAPTPLHLDSAVGWRCTLVNNKTLAGSRDALSRFHILSPKNLMVHVNKERIVRLLRTMYCSRARARVRSFVRSCFGKVNIFLFEPPDILPVINFANFILINFTI